MSLLMKALEKAAKDRGEARTEPASPAAATPAAAPTRAELSLEPMAAEAPAPSRAETAPRPAAPPRSPAATLAPAATQAREPAPTREQAQAQAQAATVIQAAASGPAAGSAGAGAYLRAHPVLLLGTLAGLFAIAFGIYVYVQIFHPGLLSGQSLIVPKAPLPPLVQAPPAPAAAPAEPLPSAPLLNEAAAEGPATGSAAPARPQPAPPAAPPEEAARGNTIVVSRGSPEPVLNPLLTQAYAALQSNQVESARDLYQKMLATDPKNIDALLGLAAIAAHQGNAADATRLYLQILELNPRHALAQSGLIALLGRADPASAESRLKQLIAREPSGYLYFTLGNLYADQSQWAAAQQAYFQAHNLEAANPDYAYNLAVGLEHISQPKLALGFYRRAVQLAAAKGRSNFNLAQAQDRIVKLAQQVE